MTPRQLRDLLQGPVDEAAPGLLGCHVSHGGVTVRVTEVEAYSGEGLDPASHAHKGPTARNASQFGPPGHAYVYFIYGMHYCLNVVCYPEGIGGGVLLRAGAVVDGLDTARDRRGPMRDHDLARGPARLTMTLDVDRRHDGTPLLGGGPIDLTPGTQPVGEIRSGPRVGVSSAADVPWRFWIADDPSVSPYRRHVPKKRTGKNRSRATGADTSQLPT
ncbi:DNA-3-methyladenine glycosylase [Stackebrandtia nassauensis]|uniref:Putative 3-methyladenine DNA glycosylase n=1 Tax=Stackebrandtia nassauensis (strain DSM 44728 / CIP 108903 / NRRL B-16338 / NBRC 102104 / LLR-40K-21) TaxID=446470 RepID=D3Q543_STANL|nr:DNA-3-methyladenine glycosylase [Stackebrandtia nassauensis]ADD44092.1 DNA-3-methyladenine glycosylase [Stackebrandtia nassauensis DSM 44728]